jgi:hypothetical protein
MQAVHKPAQGEVVSWPLIVQALQYTKVGTSSFVPAGGLRIKKGLLMPCVRWCRRARGGGPPFLVTLFQQRFLLQNRAEQ